MSLNNLPQPTTSPDYAALVRFLVEPFLLSPEGLRLDCETSQAGSRIWVRLALEEEDKGRLFGRGGKNIQAIRTLLQVVATQAGQSFHLEIYDEPKLEDTSTRFGDRYPDRSDRSDRPDRPTIKPTRLGDTSPTPVSRANPPIRRSRTI
jgi:predicted RNA-binding protein YlqC (UPF0109 family)